jgi:hypothetical protein
LKFSEAAAVNKNLDASNPSKREISLNIKLRVLPTRKHTVLRYKDQWKYDFFLEKAIAVICETRQKERTFCAQNVVLLNFKEYNKNCYSLLWEPKENHNTLCGQNYELFKWYK